ncbi:sigma-70 family RNA polymerase sigma factor [Pseudohongiella spirulinae]|uniref:RNA polymerase sigma factor n=1 Tax=Pseudohongiella spirulinae TaxID=1249552 RepID=A0A0S2KAQ7_9GAMM|nr:sigma-70 family RNA polymerase sigma factor [Pseudohongiella spirulinae]ALO45058.1 RNA polymerase sigma-70 factor [Pseudohongiella spirulinae]
MENNDDMDNVASAQAATNRAPDPWADLVRQVAQKRDRAAFQQLYKHYTPLIRAFLLKSMGAGGDRSEAEEITQEVLIKVWNKAASFNPAKASVNTWIFTIARNTRIDFIRRNERNDRKIEIEDIWHEPESPEPLVDLQQRRAEQVIRQAITSLPDEQLQVLYKAFMEGKSHNEVAEEMDLPLGTVKSRIRLALSKLQILIDR